MAYTHKTYIPKLGKKQTMFIPVPYSMRRDIDGGCQCAYCAAHPGQTPQWDTIAVAKEGDKLVSWSVHYPEISY